MRFYILLLVAITFMRLLCLYLLFFLLLLQEGFSLEQDAVLSIVLNDTILTHTPYTKLFKISNKHPSLGKLNVTVSYNLRKDGNIVMSGSFAKVINRYTTVDTGYLVINKTGKYVLCGIVYGDTDTSNNEACKTIYAVDTKSTGYSKTHQTEIQQTEIQQTAKPIIHSASWKDEELAVVISFPDKGDYVVSMFAEKQYEQNITARRTGNRTIRFQVMCLPKYEVAVGMERNIFSIQCPLRQYFSLNVSQTRNGTVFLWVNASQQFMLTVKKGVNKLYSSVFPQLNGTIMLPFVPQKDGLYTIDISGIEKKKSYSVFLNGAANPIPNESSSNAPSPLTGFATQRFNTEKTNKKELIQLPLFALFFVPLFFLAAYIVLRK